MLVRSGSLLFKYWFSVTREEQRKRFEARETDALKQWKLSPIDRASMDKWTIKRKRRRRCSSTRTPPTRPRPL